ncbi:hypothetical protein [Candidatus Thiosymbion oneisti]|uniref:hypothetical protein n=1 Tax=Candidatus Thiosymbion oneisti TaxID=589554 RepID=UPI000B7D0E9B|nr:hypothetical protein [Candidatus Thiosymbion oneisti]
MTSMLPTLNEGFTTASLEGAYAVTSVSTGGHGESAAIGVFRFSGTGRFTGNITVNGVGQLFGERQVMQASLEGTYVVDENGSGYGSSRATVSFTQGFTREVTTTILITKAELVGETLVAQELSLMEDGFEPVTGALNMVQAVRYPDGGEFSLASFQGTYGGPGIGRGSRTPAAAIGIGAVNFDGQGRFTAVDIQNLPGSGFRERRNATFDTSDGRYTVNPDGTGMIIAPGGQAHLVISRARADGDLKVALEYFFITNDLHPLTGDLVITRVSKRLPGKPAR